MVSVYAMFMEGRILSPSVNIGEQKAIRSNALLAT
jgi:hypothetical protein